MGCWQLYPMLSVLIPKPLQMPKTIGKLSSPVTQKRRGRAMPRFVNTVLIDVGEDPGPFHLFAPPASACWCWSSLASLCSQEGFTGSRCHIPTQVQRLYDRMPLPPSPFKRASVDFLSPHWSGLCQWDRKWSCHDWLYLSSFTL